MKTNEGGYYYTMTPEDLEKERKYIEDILKQLERSDIQDERALKDTAYIKSLLNKITEIQRKSKE